MKRGDITPEWARLLVGLILASCIGAVGSTGDDGDCIASRGSSSQGQGDEGSTATRIHPKIEIIHPLHNSWLNQEGGSEVDVRVEVQGYEMGPEHGCAVIYLNTRYSGKACSSSFSMTLHGVHAGTSVVDVSLLDENDRELSTYASSTFTISKDLEPAHGMTMARTTARRTLVSYGSDAFSDMMRRLAISAIEIGGFDGVMLHRPSDIEEWFAAKHSNILSKRRGRGLWLWKPYIINKTLSMMPDGDIVMYADSQLRFVASAVPLFKLAEAAATPGVVTFEMPGLTDRRYSKRRVFSAMGCEDSARCRDTGQRAATFILFRNGPQAREFVWEWLSACTQESLIGDDLDDEEDDAFLAHRHDQSLFSLLAKRRGIPAFRVPTQYGMGDEAREVPGDYGQILLAK